MKTFIHITVLSIVLGFLPHVQAGSPSYEVGSQGFIETCQWYVNNPGQSSSNKNKQAFQNAYGIDLSVCSPRTVKAVQDIRIFVNNPAIFDRSTRSFLGNQATVFINNFGAFGNLFDSGKIFKANYLKIAFDQANSGSTRSAASLVNCETTLREIKDKLTAASRPLALTYNLPINVSVADQTESLLSELLKRVANGSLTGSAAVKDATVVTAAALLETELGAGPHPLLLSCQGLVNAGAVDLPKFGHAVNDVSTIVNRLTRGMGLSGFGHTVGATAAHGKSITDLTFLITEAQTGAYVRSLIDPTGGALTFNPLTSPLNLHITGMGPNYFDDPTTGLPDSLKVGNFYRGCFEGMYALQQFAGITTNYANIADLVAACKTQLTTKLGTPSGMAAPKSAAVWAVDILTDLQGPTGLMFSGFAIRDMTDDQYFFNQQDGSLKLDAFKTFLVSCIELSSITARSINLRVGTLPGNPNKYITSSGMAKDIANKQVMFMNALKELMDDTGVTAFTDGTDLARKIKAGILSKK